MLGALLVSVFVQALLTLFVLWLVTRRDEGCTLPRLLMVTAALAVAEVILRAGFVPRIGFFYLPLQLGVILFALHDYCGLAWPRAVWCGLLLLGLNAGIVCGAAVVMPRHALVAPDVSVAPSAPATTVVPAKRNDALPREDGPATNAPAADEAPGASAAWVAARRMIAVQAVGRGSGGLQALINRQVRRVGDTCTVARDGTNYTWRVVANGATDIALAPLHAVPETAR